MRYSNQMKTVLMVILLGFLTINVQAQWYSRSFGVDSINDLNEAQLNFLLQRAETNIKTGKILTFTGIGTFAAGTVLAASGVDGFWSDKNNNSEKMVAGSLLILMGMGSTAVGVPFWIVGASRKKKVEIALLRFEPSTVTGFKQPEQIGLSLKINF